MLSLGPVCQRSGLSCTTCTVLYYPAYPALLHPAQVHHGTHPSSARHGTVISVLAVLDRNVLGSEASLSLGSPSLRDNSAQSRHPSSEESSRVNTRARGKNGRCLDTRRSKWPLITLGGEYCGEGPIPDIPGCGTELHPESPLLLTFAALRRHPVQTHLESHFATEGDPPRLPVSPDSTRFHPIPSSRSLDSWSPESSKSDKRWN